MSPFYLVYTSNTVLMSITSVLDEALKFVERQLYTTRVSPAPLAQNGSIGKPKRA